jgi:mono/diheme cytochrome c family protein
MRLLAVVGSLAIIVGIACMIFFFGGFFDIAATKQDPAVVAAALIRVRQASINHHATALPSISLEDPATVQEGAKAYAARGCVNCHGGPGAAWAKFSEGLNPGPPDLKEVAPELEPRALFWVIKNGIRMTGMPSFGMIDVPDGEIWKIVAFLKKLPTISDQDYKKWTTPATEAVRP